ncbi:hypothetical protein [Pseudomonas fragariae (ex Marin et al. 2024)]|uniref:hypothetical protein n=1 Tax=Pseudomonas fragariae (ex Marin et al. 2024) TaxID=3080056 RepID=UPI003F79070C
MVSKTNEQALEASIEKYLTGTCLEEQNVIRDRAAELPFSPHHAYQLSRAQDFNARYAIDARCLWQFLEASQSDERERLKQRYEDWDLRILERFDRLAKNTACCTYSSAAWPSTMCTSTSCTPRRWPAARSGSNASSRRISLVAPARCVTP